MITIHATNLYLTVNNEVDLTSIFERLDTMSQAIQDAIDDLGTKVETDTTVVSSAVTLLNGLTALVAQAIADAAAAGATPAQLASMQALSDKLAANNSALADAVAANTPATP